MSEEKLAFLRRPSDNADNAYDDEFLRELVHEVVQAVKLNLRVDWTAPHRDDVRAAVRAAVKRTLRHRGLRPEHFHCFLDALMEQAVVSFAARPLAAWLLRPPTRASSIKRSVARADKRLFVDVSCCEIMEGSRGWT